MTELRKPLRRETQAVYRKRPLILIIEPPNIVKVREKGRRTCFETTVERIYTMAAKEYAEKIRAERKARRKAKR